MHAPFTFLSQNVLVVVLNAEQPTDVESAATNQNAYHSFDHYLIARHLEWKVALKQNNPPWYRICC